MSWPGLATVAAISVAVAVVLAAVGRRLVFATFDPEGAQVAAIGVARLLTLYHVLLALTVIASISIVGIVLVNALLVIPAATAKLGARSLRQMFVLAPLLGISSVLVGLFGSYWLDFPSGPAIVVVAGSLFLAAWVARASRAPRRRAARTSGGR